MIEGPIADAPEAPEDFSVHRIQGSEVTLRWRSPFLGQRPDYYIIEGGVVSGQMVASIRTGAADTFLTVVLPPGVYFVRSRAVASGHVGSASAEARVIVETAVPPSAPSAILASAEGVGLRLAWQPSFTGGKPTGFILESTGAVNVQLPLTDLGLTVGAVSPGTYSLRVRAQNSAGVSPYSSTVTVTSPGACTQAPQPPSWFGSRLVGGVLTLKWNGPLEGPAASSYKLEVTGAIHAALPLSGDSVSGQLPPGSYSFSLAAVNACGFSQGTEPLVVQVG